MGVSPASGNFTILAVDTLIPLLIPPEVESMRGRSGRGEENKKKPTYIAGEASSLRVRLPGKLETYSWEPSPFRDWAQERWGIRHP